jgi:type I pantothenate kinase
VSLRAHQPVGVRFRVACCAVDVPSYQDFDRAQWAARRRGAATIDAIDAPPGEVSVADVRDVYGPLAELVADRAGSSEPFVVAVTGSVAVGKSAAASALAAAVAADTSRVPVSVVCTDGFLYPNRELAARGLLERKGFPESFDHDALARFLVTVRSGAAEARAPVYSHSTYDVVEGATQLVERPSVLVLEGLPFPADHVDLTVYLDAATADIEEWYVQRLCGLVVDAATDATSFFRFFAGDTPEQAAVFARQVWSSVNLVNLEEHILPTRERSDVILVKGPDHAVRQVRLRV